MSTGTYERYPHEVELGWTVEGLVTIEHAARLLGESYNAIDKRLRLNKLMVVRIGDTRFVTWKQIAELRRLKQPVGRPPSRATTEV